VAVGVGYGDAIGLFEQLFQSKRDVSKGSCRVCEFSFFTGHPTDEGFKESSLIVEN
jgi:hypothetical protein